MHEAKMTARSDVDVLVDTRTRFREERPELDRCRCGAPTGEHSGEERSPQVLADDPRDERQQLSRAFERPVAPHDTSANRIGDQLRYDNDSRYGSCQGLRQ